ncbi:MAG: hypothetical protein ABSA83_23625 [Verrucomicrobiota bacterium]
MNGERRPKNFSSLADAKADAKNIIKEIYAQGDSKIHLAADTASDKVPAGATGVSGPKAGWCLNMSLGSEYRAHGGEDFVLGAGVGEREAMRRGQR